MPVKHNNGIFEVLRRAMNGPLGFWTKYAVVMVFLLAAVAIWLGYNFWNADGVEAQIFWGVWFIVTTVGIGFLKLWIWWQMIAHLEDRVPRDKL